MRALPVAVTTRPPNVQLEVTGPPTYHAFTPIGIKSPDSSLTLILPDTPGEEYFYLPKSNSIMILRLTPNYQMQLYLPMHRRC